MASRGQKGESIHSNMLRACLTVRKRAKNGPFSVEIDAFTSLNKVHFLSGGKKEQSGNPCGGEARKDCPQGPSRRGASMQGQDACQAPSGSKQEQFGHPNC